MCPEAELGRDLTAHGDVVACHDLDLDPEFPGLGDGGGGVGPRRIEQREQTQKRPGLSVVSERRHAKRAETVPGEVAHLGVVGAFRLCVELAERGNRLRRALGVAPRLALPVDQRVVIGVC